MRLYSSLILVLTEAGQVYRTVARHFARPHRQAVEMGLEMMGTPFAECSEIVIMAPHPADLNLWQARKALRAGDLVVADGGKVALVTARPEKVGLHGKLPEHVGAPVRMRERIEYGLVSEAPGSLRPRPCALPASATPRRLWAGCYARTLWMPGCRSCRRSSPYHTPAPRDIVESDSLDLTPQSRDMTPSGLTTALCHAGGVWGRNSPDRSSGLCRLVAGVPLRGS